MPPNRLPTAISGVLSIYEFIATLISDVEVSIPNKTNETINGEIFILIAIPSTVFTIKPEPNQINTIEIVTNTTVLIISIKRNFYVKLYILFHIYQQ
jgi:hypothetical protein